MGGQISNKDESPNAKEGRSWKEKQNINQAIKQTKNPKTQRPGCQTERSRSILPLEQHTPILDPQRSLSRCTGRESMARLKQRGDHAFMEKRIKG